MPKYVKHFSLVPSTVFQDGRCRSRYLYMRSMVLLPQVISYSDAKVPILVVMECKRESVIHVYEFTFLLHTSRSTEYSVSCRIHKLSLA